MRKGNHTEKQQVLANQHQVHRLALVARNNRKVFEEMADYLPFVVYENRITDLEYNFHNNIMESLLGNDYEKWRLRGHAYIIEIANQRVHQNALRSIEKYKQNGDHNSVLTYFQYLKIKGEFSWILADKVYLSKSTYMTIAQPLNEFGRLGGVLEDCLGETMVKRDSWEIFQSLSKREKEIMKMLAEGHTSKQISDELYISKLTADTHRRNIFSKLQIKTYSELFKIAQGFDLLNIDGQ